jgi:hypothetical protein
MRNDSGAGDVPMTLNGATLPTYIVKYTIFATFNSSYQLDKTLTGDFKKIDLHFTRNVNHDVLV